MENGIFAVALVLIALAERFPRLRFEPRAFFRSFFRDDLICFATGAVALGLATRAVATRALGPAEVSTSALAGLPLPLVAIAAVVLYDLGGWTTHRSLHRFEPLWKLHQVHHSSRALDWLAAFRAHFLEHALRHAVSVVPLVLLGFPPRAIGIAAVTYASWAALAHSNLRLPLGWLETVLVTPRLHRLHHVTATSERNFGTIFSVWDRLAGRLVSDRAAAVAPLGVPGEVATYPQTWAAFTREPFARRYVAKPSPARQPPSTSRSVPVT